MSLRALQGVLSRLVGHSRFCSADIDAKLKLDNFRRLTAGTAYGIELRLTPDPYCECGRGGDGLRNPDCGTMHDINILKY